MHGTARLNVSDPDRIELNINSDPANLATARTTVEEFARTQGGFDERATSELGLVLNEALANVIRHAYGGATDRPIRIEVSIDRATSGQVKLTMTVRDWGTGENPQARLEHIQPNPSKPGGLGLVCLRELTNDVHFEPQPDGMLLTMRKTRRTEGSPQ